MPSLEEQPVILYDLGCNDERQTAWSPNAWKTRLVLNYKSIPYTTHWLNHTNLNSTLSALHIPANPPRTTPGPPSYPYTVPAVTVPTHPEQSLMDSVPIVHLLESEYPQRSLQLDHPLKPHETAQNLLNAIAGPLLPLIMPAIKDKIHPAALPEWRAVREGAMGMSVEKFGMVRGGDKAWEGAQKGFEMLGSWLEQMGKGREADGEAWVLGAEGVSYADLILVAFCQGVRKIVGVEALERFLKEERTGRLREIYQAVEAEGWLKRDD